MGGRSDYEERKQKRIERYKILSEKAKEWIGYNKLDKKDKDMLK